MNAPTFLDVKKAMQSKGHVVFSDARGHDLNIVGIRSASIEANTFDDWITVFYIFSGVWNFFAFPATTDPGTFYRLNPMNVDGTLVMKPGQYRGAYKIGFHRGYEALEQKSPMTVYRDANRDKFLNTSGMEEQTGIFKSNLHRASAHSASKIVGKWSAGCQVMQDPDHFNFILTLAKNGREKFGNSFTYTLLDEADFS